jgi:hypothetical protein
MPRWIITLLLVAAAAFLAWALANSRPRPAEEPPAAVAPVESSAAQGPPASPSGAAPESGAPGAPAAVAQDIEGLHIVQVGTQPEPVIGDAALSKDNPFPAQVKLTPWGAGMIDVSLSRYSAEVVLREEQFEAYPVQQRLVDRFVDGRPIYRYPLAAQAVFVNGQPFSLADQRWELVASDRTSATFVIRLADGQGAQVLRIRRTWRLEQRPEAKARDRHALYLDQQIENVSGAALSVRFAQFGPMDLPKEAGYIGDQRHVILGYLQPRRASEHRYITTDDFDLPRCGRR